MRSLCTARRARVSGVAEQWRNDLPGVCSSGVRVRVRVRGRVRVRVKVRVRVGVRVRVRVRVWLRVRALCGIRPEHPVLARLSRDHGGGSELGLDQLALRRSLSASCSGRP